MSRFFDLVTRPAQQLSARFSTLPQDHAPTETPSGLIRLDSNENPFGPSPHALEVMERALAKAHKYPDDECLKLREALAIHHGVAAQQVLVGAGSAGVISRLCQTLLAPDLNAVTSARSFIVYPMAVRAVGAELIEAPMHGDGYDLDAILAAINRDTRIVFIANPNNPTGTMLSADEIDGFLRRVPEYVVVVLDEAYFELAAHFAARAKTEYSRSIDHVRRGASVVVLRTFSKVHGLAGLRIGYGLGPAELLGYCARMSDTYAVSSVAQAGALAALEDADHIARTVANNAEQAQVIEAGLADLGYRVVPTAANFVFCEVNEDATALADRLRSQGVSVRPLQAWGAPNCMRVSIGTPEQNRAFLEAAGKVTGRSRGAGNRP